MKAIREAEWSGRPTPPVKVSPHATARPRGLSVAPMRLVFAGTPAVARARAARRCSTPRHEVVAVVTRPDAPGRPRPARWRQSPVGASAAERRRRGAQAGARRATRSSWSGCARSRPTAARSSPTARWCRRPRSTSRGTAGSTCTSRCCPPGAARRRCSTRSWPATRSPAPRTFRLEEGLDTGPVFGVVTETIGPRDTAGDLLGRLAEPAPGCWSRPSTGSRTASLVPQPQPADGVSLAPKLTVDDARVDWRAPALRVDRLVRGVHAGAGRVDDVPRRAAQARPGRTTARATRRSRPGEFGSTATGSSSAPAAAPSRSARCSRRQAAMAAADWARGAAARRRRAVARCQRPRSDRRRPDARRRRRRRRASSTRCRRRRADATPTWCCRGCCASAAVDGRDAAFATELAYGTLRWQGCSTRHRGRRPRAPVDAARPAGARRAAPRRLPAAAHARARARRGARDRRPGPRACGPRAGRASSTPCCARSPRRDLAGLGRRGSHRPTTRSGRLAFAHGHPRWVVAAFARRARRRRRRARRPRCCRRSAGRRTSSPGPAASSRDELLAQAGPDATPGRGRRTPSGSPAATRPRSPPSATGAPACRTRAASSSRWPRAPAPLDRPDERWLDLCAGPGGKAALLAALRPARRSPAGRRAAAAPGPAGRARSPAGPTGVHRRRRPRPGLARRRVRPGAASTRRAPGWARCAAGRRRAGGGSRSDVAALARCSASCSPRRSTRSGPAAWSPTSPARRIWPRPVAVVDACVAATRRASCSTPGRSCRACRRSVPGPTCSCGRTGTAPTRCSGAAAVGDSRRLDPVGRA